MPGVGSSDAAGSFPAVEGQNVGAEIVRPEHLLKSPLKFLRLAGKFLGAGILTERACQFGCSALGADNVSLHFAERHRTLDQRAVRVEDGIAGVLPTLLL